MYISEKLKCFLLLVVLSVVEVMTITKQGQVGKNVEVTCSNWRSWTGVKENVKYICRSPCTEDKHIIVRAGYGETNSKDRVEITNSPEGLFVTFFNLKMSDATKYYCGAEKYGKDSFIEVNLEVIDVPAVLPRLTTPPSRVTVGSTVSLAVLNSSTTSPSNLDVVSESYMTVNMTLTASNTGGDGSVLYLTIGFVVIVITLMVLLKLMWTVRRQLKVVPSANSPQEEAEVDAEYEEVGPEDLRTERLRTVAVADVDTDDLYANCSYLQHTELAAERNNRCFRDISLVSASGSEVDPKGAYAKSRATDLCNDMVYSVAQPPKRNIDQSKRNENECLYSLAHL